MAALAPVPGVTITTHRLRVAYADTDQGGVVHHGTYLRYLECARVEHMRERGFPAFRHAENQIDDGDFMGRLLSVFGPDAPRV